MKRIIFFGLAIITLGCQKESDVQPATGSFLRYYGSEKNHTAISAISVTDGFAMLSNIEIPIEGTTETGYKIKLIKTDLEGNQLWEKSYPEFVEGNGQIPGQNVFRAASFIALANSGYLVVGDRINADESTDLLLLRLDQEGNMLDSTTIAGKDVNLAGASLHGSAVIESNSATNSNYIILARLEWPTSNSSSKDMFVAELNVTDYSINWKREYGAGQGSLVNKILSTTDNNLFWGGSVLSYGQHDVRLIKAPENSDLPNIGSPLLTAEEEMAYDFCPVPSGYVVTGSTNAQGDEDIFVMKVNQNAGLVFFRPLDLADELDFGLNDRGNSITTGKDGALMVLATVESPVTQEDLYLIKVNPATGSVMWKNNFGGADREDGASVITLDDGSFLIYGTSYFGRVKKLLLIKVKSDGQL
ncbi:MAG TPA: hypothetical protein VGD65_21695 [Chryseosolibacter sp.]